MPAQLPPEILDMVLSYVDRQSHLKSLCEVSKALNVAATPFLYRAIDIATNELSLDPLVKVMNQIPVEHMRHTKDFRLNAPSYVRIRKHRCVHGRILKQVQCYDDFSEETFMKKAYVPVYPAAFTDIRKALDRLFAAIPKDQLDSFSWDMGTCLPEEVSMGFRSFLRDQEEIKLMSLMTDSDCNSRQSGFPLISLTQFPKLHSISWKGVRRYADFQSLSEFIRDHGKNLHSLTLDLSDWRETKLGWHHTLQWVTPGAARPPHNFLADRVLHVWPGRPRAVLPTLKDLSLSAVSFETVTVEYIQSLNVAELRSLKLWNCPGSIDFLEAINEAGVVLKLESFEFVLNLSHEDVIMRPYYRVTTALATFLESFSGLKDLYLMLTDPIQWETIVEAISHHVLTLRRLVTHQLVLAESRSYLDGWHGASDQYRRLLAFPLLTCFGSTIAIDNLLRELKRLSPLPRLQLLHIRASMEPFPPSHITEISDELSIYSPPDEEKENRESFFNLADWAFGPEGLPDLQVLVFGDFSYDGRYQQHQIRLCRSDNGHQSLTESNIPAMERLREHMDMLASCACDRYTARY